MRWEFILIFIFLIGFICASYNLEDYSIENYYAPSSNIKGWINMNLSDEKSNAFFSDSFGNEITLLELIKSNNNLDYSCNTKDCGSDYIPLSGHSNILTDMETGSEKILGFFIKGNINAINSVDFVVESDAEESCFNQIKFDFGLDGTIESGNTKSSAGLCRFLRNYGCLSGNEEMNEYIIGKFPNKHCQKINLSESASFNLGAWINAGSDARDLTMALYETNGEPIESALCKIKNATGEGEYYCGVDYLVTQQKEVYVCIYSDKSGTSKIRGHYDPNGCGFYGQDYQTENAAFQIFAEGKKFDSVGTINITNSLLHGNTLAGEMNDYLMKKYRGFNCSEGCVIPFKIYSASQQNIELKNLELKYETNLGQVIGNKFYKIEEIPPTINLKNQKIYLDEAGFKTPNAKGNYTFKLEFEEEELFSTDIYVEDIAIPRYVTPTKTASAFPTSFRVLTDSKIEIEKYIWDFGDNTTETTTTNKVTHTYEKIGFYDMKITFRDYSGRNASKNFEIIIISPKELINEKIETLQQDIETIDAKINSMEIFKQKAIKSVIDIDKISEEFKQIQKDYQTAGTEEEYNTIVKKLLEIEVPEDLAVTEKAEFMPFFPQSGVINLDVLKNIAGGDYSEDREGYVEAVRTWQQVNLNAKISFEGISGVYSDRQEELVKIFKLDIKAKDNLDSIPYIIIKNLDGLIFKENYLEQEKSGYIFIEMEGSEKSIEFSTTEDIGFANLPLFISPSLERLDLIKSPPERIINMNWKWIIIITIIVLILGLLVYLILTEWYKRRYENYLFQKRNNLYNLIFYVNDAHKKGMDGGQIKTKLKSRGWSGEQIEYVIKKYLGKRTGMIELPISKLIDKIIELFKREKHDKKDPIVKNNIPSRKI